ncbi:MAG TPA: hypothetical protein VII72_01440 [Myxococcota bacterium]|jgi:hypothetical protein
MATTSAILAACGGFLLAVLWMDLMFDVQVLRSRRPDAELPEPVLASIAGYYRRVTTDASPMGHLVAVAMAITLITLAVQIAGGQGPRWRAFASLLLSGAPILLAVGRVVPNAVRLGARKDPAARQSALARSICRDHLLCFAGVLGFVALQLSAAIQE